MSSLKHGNQFMPHGKTAGYALLLGAAVLLFSLLSPAAEPDLGPVADKRMALQVSEAWMPVSIESPATPDTRRLTMQEAEATLRRDWLFQAMGETLRQRTAREIQWLRELASRLSENQHSPDFATDLEEAEELERRLSHMVPVGAPAPAPAIAPVEPAWIWHSEGVPSKNAPAESRFFRCTFELPETKTRQIRAADLRIAADDACEVFINGVRVGSHETWQHAAAFDIAASLRNGRNVLAVRAENRPAPSNNPAGLILRLSIAYADGSRQVVASDATWRSGNRQVAGWQEADFDDSRWGNAAIAAQFGRGPWGKIHGLAGADLTRDPEAAYAHEDPAIKDLYLAVRRLKRRVMFKNPVLDFERVVLIDQPYPRGGAWTHEAIHRMGHRAVPGGRLLLLEGLHPGGKIRQLAPQKPGSFWRPDVSYDGTRVLFAYKAHDEGSFHLYEMNLDGSGLRQITNGEYDDIDPVYLPDGRIVFTTTRGNSYVRCGPFIYSYVLARCDEDGSNLYLISLNSEPDFVPAIMRDGRVIYSRWEYTDKPLWRIQSVWTTNPDGTGTAAFWGNQSIWPDLLAEARQIPGSRRVMFAGLGHHDWFAGSIGILDPTEGSNYPHGLTKVTADLRWPECSIPPEDPVESDRYHASGKFAGYMGAYPLSEEDFLVSARSGTMGISTGADSALGKFKLYLMDVFGNRELIYEGVHNAWYGIPVRQRSKPRHIPDRTIWPGTGADRKPNKPGSFYNGDVYEGVPELPRGIVKYLRVFQQDAKTYSTWNKTFRHSGPPVSIIQEEAVKRIVSVVPVESDGSVYFEAPSGKALYFQLLDENYRALQTMRSFTGLMPGEQRGCVGCHEMQAATPPPQPGIALRRPPTPIRPPPWGDESIGYEDFVQPVLDRHCGKCHQGDGDAREKLDLTLRPGVDVFKEPYLTLVGSAAWYGTSSDKNRPGYGLAGALPVETMAPGVDSPIEVVTLPPMQHLSYKSPLIELASSGKHHDVRVDDLSLRRLIAWVDAICPYMSEKEIRALGDPEFPGIERLPIRPRVSSAPRIQRP
jgi:hypothetical protein